MQINFSRVTSRGLVIIGVAFFLWVAINTYADHFPWIKPFLAPVGLIILIVAPQLILFVDEEMWKERSVFHLGRQDLLAWFLGLLFCVTYFGWVLSMDLPLGWGIFLHLILSILIYWIVMYLFSSNVRKRELMESLSKRLVGKSDIS